MKITKVISTLILVFMSSHSFAQQIDPSVLSQLSPEQIEMAKEVYNSNNTSDVQVADIPVINESLSEKTSINDPNQLNGKKYGYNFFSSTPTSTSAVGDLPLPNEYKISLRDQITVILSGSKDAIFDLNVKLNGTILFPELGAISVAGKTLGEAKEVLLKLIEQSYIGVEIDISIKNLSAKKITIVGAVNTPGIYLVNPFSTISSALAYSGGISEIGTLRNIKLIRNNGSTFSFDLYKLLIDGDRSEDITIEAGDVIVIGPAEQFITLEGEVRRQGIYEVTQNETLKDLVKFGLGFSQYANKSNIELRMLDIKSSSIQNTSVSNLLTDLANVISVNINGYVNKNMASVEVRGAIKEPGFYSLKENKYLEDIIKKLEFIDVYPWLGVLEQFDDKNLLKSTVLFNLNDPDSFSSIKLLPNSKIFFTDTNSINFNESSPQAQELITAYSLTINHDAKSYSFPVFGNFYVKSFIDFIGLDMSNVENEAFYVSPLDDIAITADYEDMNFTAKKYHSVNLRSSVNTLITVNISGAIEFPSSYTLQAGTTIDELYKLVGKFSDNAYLEGIVFLREEIRNKQLKALEISQENLNRMLLSESAKGNITEINSILTISESIEPENLGRVAGNYSPQSSTSRNTILFDGDSLIVPNISNTISVIGEVLNPTTFEYTNKIDVRSAISNAGGFKDYADKRKIYVIKASGITEIANRKIFRKNISLNSGDTIVVPLKIPSKNPFLESITPITTVISDLAFSAAALDNLSNN
jgi:polysaccharide biosynthesis/export protein